MPGDAAVTCTDLRQGRKSPRTRRPVLPRGPHTMAGWLPGKASVALRNTTNRSVAANLWSLTSPVRQMCRACKRRTTSHLASPRVGGFGCFPVRQGFLVSTRSGTARLPAQLADVPEMWLPRGAQRHAGLFPLARSMGRQTVVGRPAAAQQQRRRGSRQQMRLWRSHQRRNAHQRPHPHPRGPTRRRQGRADRDRLDHRGAPACSGGRP